LNLAFRTPFQRIPIIVRGQLGLGVVPRKVNLKQLLEQSAVQSELKLTNADRKRWEDFEKKLSERWARLAQEYGTRIQQIRAGGDPGALAAAQESIGAEANSRMDEADAARLKLLAPAQRTRLLQIRLQTEGPAGFERPDVIERLNLDPDQTELIRTLVDEGRQRADRASEVQLGSVAPGELYKSVSDVPVSKQYKDNLKNSTQATISVRAETMRAIARVLSKKQRATYAKLVGAPFDLAKLREGGTTPGAVAKPAQPAESSAKGATPDSGTSERGAK
jgi:hypothetical protein